MGIGDDDGDGNSGEDIYRGRAEPVLVLLLDSYSEDDRILGR